MTQHLFEAGFLTCTASINNCFATNSKFRAEIQNSIERHLTGDYSDMEHEEDIALNEEAIISGNDRIFSSYNTSEGKIWIITEHDRSATTVLFPEDY